MDAPALLDPHEVRARFDLPADRAYLNTAYMGPLPLAAVRAGEEALRAKSHPWTVPTSSFFEPVELLREGVARLLGADADGVALCPSVSYGVATAATNLEVPAGSTVVVLEEQFPSNVYAWREVAARNGAEVLTAPRSDSGWTAGLLERIDDRTAVVAVEQFHWSDGTAVDLVEVGRACRSVGAALVVDVSQSLGAVPFDHDAIRPDVVVGVLYKWLLGPYGSSYAWFAPHLRGGRPIEWTWIARAGSEAFAALADYTDRFRPGARRYDCGEVSSHVNVAVATAALDLVSYLDPQRIAAHSAPLVDEVAARADEMGAGVPAAAHRAPHLLGLQLPAGATDPQGVSTRLAEAGVHVSVRGTTVRVSVHAFNTRPEVERLLDALAETLRT